MPDPLQRRWDLWHLKTMFPAWDETEYEALLAAGRAWDELEQAALADPAAAWSRFGPAAAGFLRRNPDLAGGLIVSLHLGPYAVAPVPWLAAGHDLHVLVNRTSLAGIRDLAATLESHLGLPGRLRWVPIEGRLFALRLARVLRRGDPVFAYLDGNDGLEGPAGTLQHGIPYRLPGRTIRVRTGLARLALRLGCPVHAVATRWCGDGTPVWERGPRWDWPRSTTPEAATQALYDWAYAAVRRNPDQWRAWTTLTGVCDSFRLDAAPPVVPPVRARDLLAAPARHRALVWRRAASIWPGDMLEDIQAQCFYHAAGLTAGDLEYLRRSRRFTPADLERELGRTWVRTHLPRLLALGFVARAGTPPDPDPAELPVDPPSGIA